MLAKPGFGRQTTNDSDSIATTASSVRDICLAAKRAARGLALLDSASKDAALLAVADALEARIPEILEANARDMEAGREAGLDAALLDRLRLDEGRVAAMARGVREIVALPDPVGEVVDGSGCPTGSTCAGCASPSAWWPSSTRRGPTSRSTPRRWR